MQTVMQTALKTAGLAPKKVPLNKRIWLWLKDHPEKSYKEIAAALGAPDAQVSGQLSYMENRGMLIVFSDMARNPHPMTGVTYKIKRYSCKYKEFELLPELPRAKRAAPGSKSNPQPIPQAAIRVPPWTPLAALQQAVEPIKVNGRKKSETEVITLRLDGTAVAHLDALVERFIADHDITINREQMVSRILRRHAKGQT